MGLVFSLLLIVLGALVAQDFLFEKVPASKKFIEKLNPHKEYIGAAGLVFGLVWLLDAIGWLRYVNLFPLHILEIWISAGLLMTIGMMLSIDLLKKIMNNPVPSLLTKASQWRDDLAPYKKHLGIAAMALGLIYIL